MIEEIVPAEVVAVEMRRDSSDVELSASERGYVEHAVGKRQVEFTTGRVCTRRAQELLGLEPVAVPVGDHGEPCWPRNLVGSITHCADYRACALARSADIAAIGIDAEPHAPLPSGVLEEITVGDELQRVRTLKRRQPAIHWDRVLFCAKESLYKALFPVVQRVLSFDAADVMIDENSGNFRARLAPELSSGRRQDAALTGRWAVCDGLVLTAVAVRGGQHPLCRE